MTDCDSKQSSNDFYTTLEEFYRRQWNCPLKIPHVAGQSVDFYKLYKKVTSLGGWVKVTIANRWNEVAEVVRISRNWSQSEHAVKLLYLRYLAKFEQVSLGEDSYDDEEASTSHRSRSQNFLMSLLPPSGPQGVPKLNDALRSSWVLPARPKARSSYQRLIRSLESGLPNEVDFAVNVCILLSNPGPTCLRLTECTSMINVLLAHAGIFDDAPSSLRALYDANWKQYVDRDLIKFWHDVVSEEDVKELIGPSDSCPSSSWQTNELFNLAQEFDYRNVVCQRIVQIASVFRNLSFEHSNRAVLAKSDSLATFLLLCISCRWSLLQSLAMDTLSNIASDLIVAAVDAKVTQLLFRALTRCLFSDDKFKIIRALETVGNLCLSDKNEGVLLEFLHVDVLSRLLTLVSVKDIMMCVYLMECLYQISEVGQSTCLRIAQVPNAIDTLVNLVTIEAVSFGTGGLVGMKVVQYGPQDAAGSSHNKTSQASVADLKAASVTTSLLKNSVVVPRRERISLADTFTKSIACPDSLPNVLKKGPNNNNLLNTSKLRSLAPNDKPAIFAPYKSAAGSSADANVSEDLKLNSQVVAVKQQQQAVPTNVMQDPRSDTMALNWLKTHCTADVNASVPQTELFQHYTSAVSSSNVPVLGLSSFCSLLNQAFPLCNYKPVPSASGGQVSIVIEGLKVSLNTSGAEALSTTEGSGDLVPQPTNSEHLSATHATSFKPPPYPNNNINNNTPAISGSLPNSVVTFPTAKAPSSFSRILFPGRPESEASYSAPSTPDSCASGSNYDGSNHGYFNSRSSSPTANPCIGTPKSPGSCKRKKIRLNNTQPDALVRNGGVPVNGSLNISLDCRLEVCQQAEEARTIIEDEVSHEAKIIRVENNSLSTDDGSSQNGDATATSEKSESCGELNGVENMSTEETSEDISTTAAVVGVKHETVKTVPASSTSSANLATTTNSCSYVNGEASTDVSSERKRAKPVHTNNCHNKKSRLLGELLASDNFVEKMKKSNLNGSVVPVTGIETAPPFCAADFKKNCIENNCTEESPLQSPNSSSLCTSEDSNHSGMHSCVASTSSAKQEKEECCVVPSSPSNSNFKEGRGTVSPGPDLDSFKKNLNNCQMNIEMMLHGAVENDIKAPAQSSESFTDVPASDIPNSRPKKSTKPKKEAVDRKESPAVVAEKLQKRMLRNKSQQSIHCDQPLVPDCNSSLDGQSSTVSSEATQSKASAGPGETSQQPQNTVIIHRILPPRPDQLKLMCEWNGCGKLFSSSKILFHHIVKGHIANSSLQCMWPHCDKTVRLPWALATHIHDIHCNEQLLKLAAIRRYEISQCGATRIAEPKTPPPHPGYSPDAASSAIRRHAMNFLAKELTNETEGPVTKSLRLTTSLILRNLARYSSEGRRLIKRYETRLAYLTFSNLESSVALSQCLAELSSPPSPFSSVS